MKHIRLSFFKRILLQVLLAAIYVTYHAQARSVTVSNPTVFSTNSTYCPSTSSEKNCFHISSILGAQNYKIQLSTLTYYSSTNTVWCVCLSTLDLQNAESICGSVNQCAQKYPNTSGILTYNFGTEKCDGTIFCEALPGYYAYATNIASACPKGYYCPGGSMISNIKNALASSIACTNSQYQNLTGQSTCKGCPTAYNVQGTTGKTAATSLYDCYIASTNTMNDGTGVFKWLTNCPNSST